ncbi:hypothetical protein ACOMHN_034549 [Nucella lapillus]
MRIFNYTTATKVGRPDVSAISKDEDHISFKFRRSVPKLPERNYISSKENVKGKPSASTLTSKCPADVSQSTIHTTQGPEVRLTASATENGSRLSLVNIYYPESCNHADLSWLQNLDAAHWVIIGDFNAHHSWWGGDGSITDAAGRQLAEKIMTSDLCLLNDGTHTRVPDRADHGATAIDLTLVSSSLYGEIKWETSSELWGSDHLPISLLLRGVQLREDSVARVTYDYSNADWNGFQHLLATAVYPSPTDNIDIWYEDLRDVILQAAEGMIPKKVTTNNHRHPPNPWWNVVCAKGFRSTSRTTCELCAHGQYQNTTGSSNCEGCASGKTTLQTGSVSVDDCMPQ